MHLAIKHIFQVCEQLLYPSKCLKCGKYMETPAQNDFSLESCFCTPCMKPGVSLIDKPYCTRCGLKFSHAFTENHVCENCLKKSLKLVKVRAAAEYRGVMKDAVHLLKYQSKLSIAKMLEHLMVQTFETHFKKEDIHLVMPVPLHRKRLKARGFNQAFILIRHLAEWYEKKFRQLPPWQVNTQAIIRDKKTAPQTGFDIVQRRKNLKGAFRVTDKKAVENKHILLIDDVFTTGATCNEAAKELLKNGAVRVDAMVLART